MGHLDGTTERTRRRSIRWTRASFHEPRNLPTRPLLDHGAEIDRPKRCPRLKSVVLALEEDGMGTMIHVESRAIKDLMVSCDSVATHLSKCNMLSVTVVCPRASICASSLCCYSEPFRGYRFESAGWVTGDDAAPDCPGCCNRTAPQLIFSDTFHLIAFTHQRHVGRVAQEHPVRFSHCTRAGSMGRENSDWTSIS